MRKEYDFTNSVKNPYTAKLRKQITIRIDADAIDYFKRMASSTGIPYQNLINLYLCDCAENGKQVSITWQSA